MKSMMFSDLQRNAGGRLRLINSAGFNDNVPAANAGMPSIQNCNKIRSIRSEPAWPANFFHAGLS